MTTPPFESYAQNGEDVVLWRALGPAVDGAGRYVDVGANDPVVDSISWAFYQRGWRGITAEPVAELAAAHRALRPDDVMVEAVVGELDEHEVVLHHISGTGLSTIEGDIAARHAQAGWTVEERPVPVRRLDDVLAEQGWDDGRDVHLMTIDTEGSEAAVLTSLDLHRYRPWVLVVEATAPTSSDPTHQRWEQRVLDAGYVPCLFDGLSRFYVARERADVLAPALGYPACSLDAYTTRPERALVAERDHAREQLRTAGEEAERLRSRAGDATREALRWRSTALQRWSATAGQTAVTAPGGELDRVRAELHAVRRTLSWRVTRPLRAARTVAASGPVAPVLRNARWQAAQVRPQVVEARAALRSELVAALPAPAADRLRSLRRRAAAPPPSPVPLPAPGDSAGAPADVLVSAQRLRAIAHAMLGPTDAPSGTGGPAQEFAELLDLMVARLQREPSAERTWLLVVALSGRFPGDDDLRLAVRTLELADRTTATLWLLEDALQAAAGAGTAGRPLELVEHGVVVDVDFSAQHDLHSGIQRVVRTTLPRWVAAHDVVPVVWTAGHQALRRLSGPERDRVLAWGRGPTGAAAPLPDSLVVPWHSTVVLLEVPARETCERLAAVGQWSGNRVVAVGYDCIPIVSAGLVPLVEPNRFVHYLTAVKHMAAVAGISVSATSEFRGFAQMLPGQGLTGPHVTECLLPVDATGTSPDSRVAAPSAEPLVVCVGSFEPRKNQLAVLWAAEVLWREGLSFRLRFIGAGGTGTDFPRAVRKARKAGRPVEVLTAITDESLDESYRAARFSVFVSVHEGYGLPVAESLARSTPALVTGYGSTREIGADGGTLFADPRDDLDVLDGMRRLLVDDDLLTELREQIAKRPQRTWDDYAAQLWEALDLSGDHCGAPSALVSRA